MSSPFKYILVALALLVGAAGLTLLHLENRRLQRRVAAGSARAAEAARLREDNARLERLLTSQGQGAEASRALVRRDTERLRAEIAALERNAEQQRAARDATTMRDEATIAANRDPRQGVARLEHFQNRGQTTPSAAFETLVWAALKGDDTTLASVTALNSATKAKAEAFLAQLPAEQRAPWTPEKLGRLWFTGLFTEVSALQIIGENRSDADESVLRLRFPGRDDEEKLAVRLTPDGWKVLVPGAAVEHLKKKLQSVK